MMKGMRNRSTQGKPALLLLFPPQILHGLAWHRTRAAAVGSHISYKPNITITLYKVQMRLYIKIPSTYPSFNVQCDVFVNIIMRTQKKGFFLTSWTAVAALR
jgi:hypothetical protein